ncbi:hypothetical protein GCK32_001310 [Trichostrongylus colubriformis]|uniref:Uncharacterized protein n=1 Tax=Trichostrongylus colubriformis TaxID=6319 RepID=A0AAN8FTS7_TRICO
MKLVLIHVHAYARNQDPTTPSEPREAATMAGKQDVEYDGLKELVKLVFGVSFEDMQRVYSKTDDMKWSEVSCTYQNYIWRRIGWEEWGRVRIQEFFDRVSVLLIRLAAGEMTMEYVKSLLREYWLNLKPEARKAVIEDRHFGFSGFAIIDRGFQMPEQN